jgi:hypothetical protein
MTRMVNTMGLTSELSTAEKYMHQSSNQGSRKHRRSPRQMDKHDRTLHRTKKNPEIKPHRSLHRGGNCNHGRSALTSPPYWKHYFTVYDINL